MTIEQVKAEAKNRFGQDRTDEQAEAILENHSSEELSAQVLEEVTGGANNIKITYVDRNMSKEMPNVYLLLEQMNEEATRRLKSDGSEELSAKALEDVAGGLHYELDVIHNGTEPGTINIYNTEELSPQELGEVRGGSDLKLRVPLPKDFLAKLESYAADGRLEKWLAARSSKELSDQELDNVAGGGCGSDDPAASDPEDDTPQNQQ